MSDLSLQQLQRAFMVELSGDCSEAFRGAVKDNRIAGKMDKAQRIDIYYRNHVGARVNGLGNVYPVCRQILGEQRFDRLATDYVATFVSDHWDLNYHGKDFDQYLKGEMVRLDTLAELFYLPDLARLEWVFHLCYFAAANNEVVITSQQPEQLRFIADSSLQWFSSEWPVYQIWHNNRQNKGALAVEDTLAVYHHLVFREALVPQVYLLSEPQYLLLADCIKGLSLTELAELHGEVVAANIPLFIQQKWLFLCN
jgi:hypothetical protein